MATSESLFHDFFSMMCIICHIVKPCNTSSSTAVWSFVLWFTPCTKTC